jgi:hypothetical protein
MLHLDQAPRQSHPHHAQQVHHHHVQYVHYRLESDREADEGGQNHEADEVWEEEGEDDGPGEASQDNWEEGDLDASTGVQSVAFRTLTNPSIICDKYLPRRHHVISASSNEPNEPNDARSTNYPGHNTSFFASLTIHSDEDGQPFRGQDFDEPDKADQDPDETHSEGYLDPSGGDTADHGDADNTHYDMLSHEDYNGDDQLSPKDHDSDGYATDRGDPLKEVSGEDDQALANDQSYSSGEYTCRWNFPDHLTT